MPRARDPAFLLDRDNTRRVRTRHATPSGPDSTKSRVTSKPGRKRNGITFPFVAASADLSGGSAAVWL